MLGDAGRRDIGIARASVAVVRTAASVALLVTTLMPMPLRPVAAAPASPMPPASQAIQIFPDAPVQGDTMTVLVSAPDHAQVTVRWDGAAVPAFAAPEGVIRALIGTDPDIASGGHTIRVTIKRPDGTVHRMARLVRLRLGQFAVRHLTLSPTTFALMTPKNFALERETLGPVLSRRTPVAWWQGPFQAPSIGLMDSPYGQQGIYNGHRMWWHQGMDYAAPADAPVAAANTGIIALARALPLGGNTVVIDHGQGVLTEYLHLSSFAVREGDRVEKGATIGRIGATGLVTGPSLHWGLYVNGIPVNPQFWMESRPGLTSHVIPLHPAATRASNRFSTDIRDVAAVLAPQTSIDKFPDGSIVHRSRTTKERWPWRTHHRNR